MNKTKWIIFAVVVVAVFAGIIAMNKSEQAKPFTGDASKVITDGPITDHVYGSKDNKVILIEYGDYQCPACGAMYQPIKDITEQYKDKLTFIFRNMPLTNIHPNALAAATAAEAAGLQGKYFEMYDLLYTNQTEWAEVATDKRAAVFEGYASGLGIDMTKYKKDLASRDIAQKISRDKSTGLDKFGAQGTPTFVLNGKVMAGADATDAAKFRAAVEAALKAAYGDAFTPIPSADATQTTQSQE
jgi:protein-disulfide isomerase